MSFAQEIEDFLVAYKTVSSVLNENEKTRLAEEEAASMADYRKAATDKMRWDMGAEDREALRVIGSVGSKDSTFGPLTPISGNYNAAALEQAFADTESFGGDWGAVGPETKYGHAYGKYQVLEPNVGPWTAKYYGQELSPEEFLVNKDAQQAVFHGEMGRMVGQYGNLEDAMSEWFTGDDYATAVARNASDQNMGVVEYVDRVASAYNKYSGSGKLAAATGEPVAQGDISGAVDDLGTSDPAYQQYKEERYGTAPLDAEPAILSDTTAAPALSTPDYWDDAQKAAATGVNSDLMTVVTRASQIAGFPIGMNVATVDGIETAPGLRTPEQQKQFVEAGWSKTNNSKHLKGRATDLVPLVNGKPMDASQVTDEQWNAINAAMAQASKETGIPVEWGGNWKGFVDKPHYQLPDSWEGLAETTGTEPVSVTGDVNAINDAAVVETAATPTAPAVPAAETATPAAPAIPEEGGYDPLPQTSGHTDAVSRSSHDAVEFALADRSTPITTILKAGMGFGKRVLGTKPKAIDDGEPDPGATAFADGVGGAPVDLIAGVEKAVEERYGPMTQDRKQLEVMSTIWNYWMRQGKPEKAEGAVFAIYQSYKVMAQKTLGLAKVAAEDGDIQDAAEKFAAAYSLVPDGHSMTASVAEDGTVVMNLTNEKTGEVTEQRLDAEDLVSRIMGISPDQFDDLVEARLLGEEPDAAEPLTDLPMLTAPTAPTGDTEQAIPEVPGQPGVLPTDPAAKDDEYSLRTEHGTVVPAGTTDVPGDETEEPVTAAPAGEVRYVTADGRDMTDAINRELEDAAADKGAPLTPEERATELAAIIRAYGEAGDPVTGKVMTPAAEEAIPTEAGEVGEGGEGDATAIPEKPVAEEVPYKVANQNEPSVPISLDEFNKLATERKWTAAQYDQYYQVWKAQTEAHDAWVELQPTAASIAEKQALGILMKGLQDTPPDARYDPPDAQLFLIQDEKLRADARLLIDAHNDVAKQMMDEGTAAAKEAADTAAQEKLFEIEQGAFGEKEAIPESQPVTPGPMPPSFRIGTKSGEVPAGLPAQPEEQIAYPAEAGALPADRYDKLTQRIDTENAKINERNTKRFTPAEPIDYSDANVVARRSNVLETLVPQFFSTAATNAGTNPQLDATVTLLQDNIKRHGLDNMIGDAVMELGRMPNSMGDAEATETVLSMLSVIPDDPTRAPYTAAFVDDPNVPGGLVEVTIGTDPPFRMPYTLYDSIDDIRSQMAYEQLPQATTARAAADRAAQKAATSAEALANQDKAGQATANEYYNVPPAPPVDTGENVFPEYP